MLQPHRLLIGFLALLTVENLARAALSVEQMLRLPNLPTALSPVYVAITSAVWLVLFGACAVFTAMALRWTPRAVLAVAVAYQVYLWVNRLAFSANSAAWDTAGFRVLLSIAMLTLIALLLWLSRSRYARTLVP